MTSTPAGWYPDPTMVNTVRYWDGEKWTDQHAPAPLAPQAAPHAPPIQQAPRQGLPTAARVLFKTAAAVFVGGLAVIVGLGLLGYASLSTAFWYVVLLLTPLLVFAAFVAWLVGTINSSKSPG